MREIKFRAWDIEQKKMIPVGSLYWNMSLEIRHLGYLEVGEGIRRIEYFELMQYTGLKDKNGKEIYEGDIVMPPDYQTEENKHYMKSPEPYEIKMPDVYYATSEGAFLIENCEIIGNIYENKELLK